MLNKINKHSNRKWHLRKYNALFPLFFNNPKVSHPNFWEKFKCAFKMRFNIVLIKVKEIKLFLWKLRGLSQRIAGVATIITGFFSVSTSTLALHCMIKLSSVSFTVDYDLLNIMPNQASYEP